MKITTEKQQQIIDAYFSLAEEKKGKRISLKMIAEKIGIRRESIIKYHFKNTDAILNHIHKIIEQDLTQMFEDFLDCGKGSEEDMINFIKQDFLPFLYSKKEWMRLLYYTGMDPYWIQFLEDKYTPLAVIYIERQGNNSNVPTEFLARIIVKQIMGITSAWLMADKAEPSSLFADKFIEAMKMAPFEILSKKP
ncbi:TetR/AcrR family transcriptional regulator [Lactococcus termiticola]|uniref:Transcription regulator n=1 Tax=Lactococcus termiticola TaxID=2169526 RepID=A0A2R5HF19_9LACT|nr:TetR/AcrR family transcriptional regulator [Lactococcus termiticola]GBG96667.1 transcription regulator [Lactococcus termiticola]